MDRYEKGKKCLEDIQKAPVDELFKELEDIAPDLSRFVIEFPYSEIYTRSDVDLKTRELCTVAALTTLGTIPQLKDHINAALNVGNSPSEIVEIIMQMCAYAGFPKSINGVMAAKEVFKEKGLLWRGIEITFETVGHKLQEELVDIIKNGKETNDYELIVFKYVFISELEIPLVEDLNFEIVDDGFVVHIIPDNLKFDLLVRLNNVFDKFEIMFMPNSYNVLKLKFVLCDWMYSDEEKRQLMDDLVEMETFKADVGDEGKILQEDLKKFFSEGIGDKEDLIFRLELYFYAFKLFCRKKVSIKNNQFMICLNDSLLEWDLIKLVMQDFTDFELVIESVKENSDVLINLNFTYHF